MISYKACKKENDKFLHVLNIIKYASGLVVIVVGAMPRVLDSGNVLFMLCAAFNSLYSFFWDVYMVRDSNPIVVMSTGLGPGSAESSSASKVSLLKPTKHRLSKYR